MSNLSNNMNNNDSASFDLFAKPETDDLAEHLAKGSYQWTNKYTKFLGITAIVVALLSAGAWYGHHSATSAANSSLGTSLNSLRSAFGGAREQLARAQQQLQVGLVAVAEVLVAFV